jgi:hypothetical protein
MGSCFYVTRISDFPQVITRAYRLAVAVLSLPIILGEFFDPETGAEYDVGTTAKIALAARMVYNNSQIPTGSSSVEHLVMAAKILNTPAEVDGCIVECGCFKGGSTANLSLVAGLCDRTLHVFDSFEGMPEPTTDDEAHLDVASQRIHSYEENSWDTSVAEVKENVTRYGDPGAVVLHPGYFEETMAGFEEPCVAAFLDVGLRASAETALEHLWPVLQNDSYCFTHEAKFMDIADLFFDREWWRETLDTEPPGLVGAGSGIGLHPGSNGFSSLLAYIVKNPTVDDYATVAQMGADNVVNVGAAESD